LWVLLLVLVLLVLVVVVEEEEEEEQEEKGEEEEADEEVEEEVEEEAEEQRKKKAEEEAEEQRKKEAEEEAEEEEVGSSPSSSDDDDDEKETSGSDDEEEEAKVQPVVESTRKRGREVIDLESSSSDDDDDEAEDSSGSGAVDEEEVQPVVQSTREQGGGLIDLVSGDEEEETPPTSPPPNNTGNTHAHCRELNTAGELKTGDIVTSQRQRGGTMLRTGVTAVDDNGYTLEFIDKIDKKKAEGVQRRRRRLEKEARERTSPRWDSYDDNEEEEEEYVNFPAEGESGSRQSSKYRGVTWYKKNNKWRAYIRYDVKQHSLGYFEDEEEAARAYDRAARAHKGGRALRGVKVDVNFPAEGKTGSRKPSKYRGVAQIRYDGKQRRLGCFEDEEEAARAYDNAARAHQGDVAKINFEKGYDDARPAKRHRGDGCSVKGDGGSVKGASRKPITMNSAAAR
jgi:hypothetical protein